MWAGSDGESGLLDSDAFILLYLPNRQRWQTLLHPRDFLDLPAFFPTLEGTNPRLRRTRLRSIVRNGSLDWYIKQLQKSQEQIKTWVWVLAGGGIILAGLLLLAFAPSGAPP